MKYFYLFYNFCFLSLNVAGQITASRNNDITTEIQSKNQFDISIIQIFPQEFPKVSVVFQAKNELGEPLWLLTKDEFNVRENTFECEIIDVRNISEKRPLNLALVFDHSGSMIENPEHMTDTSVSYQDLYFYGMLPDGYVMSIEYAQEAVLNFFNVESQLEDSMFFVGFSKTVDKIEPLTNNFDRFERIVKNVKPEGWTAFYDAVYSAVDSLKNHRSQPAVIALTDGGDNSSVHEYDELIEFANKHQVPIYIIGLGNVNSSILNHICTSTNGFYYHTNEPTKLTEIYENIKKQLRSIYELDYVSNEDNSVDPFRKIKFYFNNDTLSFNSNEFEFELPQEVVEHLENRHEELRKKQEELREQAELEKILLIGGSITGVLLLGIGGFVIVRRKKKKSIPKIVKIFPNPFLNQLTVNYVLPNTDSAMLRISNMSGSILREEQVSSEETEYKLDLSELESGAYLISISSDGIMSNVIKAIKN